MTNPVLEVPHEARRSGAALGTGSANCAGRVAVSTLRDTRRSDRYDGRTFGDAPSGFDRALVDELERSDIRAEGCARRSE